VLTTTITVIIMKFAGRFRSRMESRQKRLATSYRSIPFYAIAILQLIASIVVFGIMLYFIIKLRGSHMPVPYTFVIVSIPSNKPQAPWALVALPPYMRPRAKMGDRI
jgi:uncharacterized membrane protein YbhN (UPF0104 family)